MTPSDILGTWTLDAFIRHRGVARDAPLGRNATGLLLYTSDGHMAAFLHRDPALKASAPALAAYAGRWTLENDAVHHDVAFNTDVERVGTVLVRFARFEGAKLILHTERKMTPQGVMWIEIFWKRPQAV